MPDISGHSDPSSGQGAPNCDYNGSFAFLLSSPAGDKSASRLKELKRTSPYNHVNNLDSSASSSKTLDR